MNWLRKNWQKIVVFWKNSPRALQLILVNVIWLLFVIVPLYCHFAPLDEELLKGAGIWNFFTLILAIPSAFMVWYFRDENNKESIENQRKDINLKDFQKLSELAAGMYLVEDKVIKEEGEKTVTKTESSQTPENSISRREASEALQIAAVYQLKAFLDGEHGKYFKRSTFHLLISIWRTLTQPYMHDHDKLRKITLIEPLPIAIKKLLAIDNGKVFHEHKDDLILLSLPGMILTDLNLQGLNFSFAIFQHSFFSDTNFSQANLSFVIFINADLSNTNLSETVITSAKFSNANLKGSKIYNPINVENAIFTDAICDESTEIYVHVDGKVKKEETLKLRNQLKVQGLILPDEAYDIIKIPDKIEV